ncbi:hypothetical protein [Sphingomicrobium astaxanthinifaciens]|uniref:hypothetical protein n=1 Tax=Sphingomicrobium astaxanthinifaciens TaxID=1227949 RepID=UPI001FCC88F0|nr:hypothetical protein [Sphingomicrobium astaxanthinifaciens]MCJ7421303.1 hypothetical protein [Sphingomicrobium astaxanthinifaciens]
MIVLAALFWLAQPASAIEAERAFADDARAGQWFAFAKWADDDAILVARSVFPAKAVAAVLAADGEPAVPIAWWPAVSLTSCDGGHAFNRGPFFDPASAQAGNFHTIWRLTEEGWRYRIDMGLLGDPVGLEGVEQPTIVCDSLPAADPPVAVETDTMKGGIDMSADASLKWEWRHGVWGGVPEPRRMLRVWAWNGDDYDIVHLAEGPAE